MADELKIEASDKEGRYIELLPQVEALVKGESDLIANCSNICAALKYGMGYFWVGFYFVKEKELVLGPFQGPVACTRIAKGKGVCGKAWELKETILVPNVDEFPGHIACSSLSKSEIVIPVFDATGNVTAVLDVDSEKLNDFDETDLFYLKKITQLIALV